MIGKKSITKKLLIGAFLLGSFGVYNNIEASTQTLLSEKQIQEIILKDNPNAKVLDLELDKEGGILTYEVKTFDGTTSKEYKIEATSGNILKIKVKPEMKFHPDMPNPPKIDLSKVKLSIEEAKQIAIKNSDNGTIESAELKSKYGRAVYEIEINKGFTEKEFIIDANTGEILRVRND